MCVLWLTFAIMCAPRANRLAQQVPFLIWASPDKPGTPDKPGPGSNFKTEAVRTFPGQAPHFWNGALKNCGVPHKNPGLPHETFA